MKVYVVHRDVAYEFGEVVGRPPGPASARQVAT